MTASFKSISSILILAGMLGLTACDSSSENAAQDSPAISPTAVSAVVPTEVPSTGATATAVPEKSPTAAPAEASPEAETGSAPAPAADTQNTSKQLKELLELAKQGKVPGVEYAAHSGLIDEVEQAWGKPDRDETAGKGMYATYNDKKVVFGYNKGSQIFDVRSSAAQFRKLTLKQIEGTLGKPDDIKQNGKDMIYTYTANKQYQLKFIIPASTGKVDHISVFSEQDSINNMAG